jgi:SAM-dependent methyltransferase
MSTVPNPAGADSSSVAPQTPIPAYLETRSVFARHYLFGEGLEIGPLHQPLTTPPHAKARYVDRMSVADLRRHYPELAGWNLTEVDIVDDGEKLATIAEESQDFIVANHFLEHTEDPIGTIETHLGKLRPGGVLFYAVPDKRFTFDLHRPVTPVEHMVADHEGGPERSRAEHYEEWVRFVEPPSDEEREASDDPETAKARALDEADYSIHMHVWTQAEFLALILAIRARTEDAFDVEVAARRDIEFIVVLRKAGPMPDPVAPTDALPAQAPPPRNLSTRRRMRKALQAAKREMIRD